CLEEADNGKNLQMLRINTNSPLKIDNEKIIANGFRQKQNDKWYFEFKIPCKTETELTFIPYYKWGNRGENEMTVYIRY
ncbi:MAG: glycoside hydrolase family 127 protein, partial [Clostridia bacterium]|nr:glycoside hydrolase family 127 protein [Clostridia bacterium]